MFLERLVIMATRKPAVPAMPAPESTVLEIVSIKDAAYRQAAGHEKKEETLENVAKYVRLHHPKYPHEADEVLDTMLAEGYLLKLSETERGAAKQYGYVDGNYINVTQLAAKPKGIEVLTIAYATGLSNYDYRKLDNPDKKKVVAEIRDMASTYISQQKKALHDKLAEIDDPNAKKNKKRGDNKTIRKHYEDVFSNGDKKIKIAVKLGDPDANPELHKEAVAAFWAVMNRKKK
jgi:hypothetical protein